MIAITTRNSALHREAGDLRPIGTLREQRAAQLRIVLEGANLGLLLLTLEKAGIRTLKKFNEHTSSCPWKLLYSEQPDGHLR